MIGRLFLILYGLTLVLIGVVGTPGDLGALLPPVIAFAAIFVLRKAWAGLLLGGIAGAFLLSGGMPLGAIRVYLESGIFPALDGSWHVGAILFTFILGAFAAVVEASGGFGRLMDRVLGQREGGHGRRFQLTAGGFGLICFFDGLANSLLVGRVLSRAADRAGVSRVKLAYIADSTGSALACVAFISTWIAAQLTYIGQAVAATGVEGAPSAYALFFASIPYNFYCLLTLGLVFVVAWTNWNPGAMARFEARAEAGRGTGSGEEDGGEAVPGAAVWRAVVPLVALVVAIPFFFYVWETEPLWPVTLEKLRLSFGGSAGPFALTAGAAAALFAAWLGFPRRERPGAVEAAMSRGAAAFLHPILILILAWTFGNMLKTLGTAAVIADFLSGGVSPAFFPMIVFLTAAVTSFVTGSSWGTMGLIMPIAIPTLFSLDPALAGPDLAVFLEYLPPTIAAVFGGAVFGDHCSPFSDTTIVSSVACGVEPGDHVRTQMPYALFVAITSALVGYGSVGLGAPGGLGLILGLGVIMLVPWLALRRARAQS